MPYQSRKVRGKDCYRVINKRTKKVFAKCSTLENSKKQMRLLRAIENNKKFMPYSSRKRKSSRRRTIRKNNGSI
jgi:hypothetical protein